MIITILGGTGFIGNHLILELLNHDIKLIVTGTNINKAKSYSWFDSVIFIELNIDIEINSRNLNLITSSDKIIDLIWTGLPNYNKLFHFEKNLLSHYNFLKNLIKNGAKEIIITGTCFEYGMQEGALGVSLQTNPMNPYALAKDTLRKFLEMLQKYEYPFKLKWLRLFYMYGDGQSPTSILSLLDNAIKNGDEFFNMSMGNQKRDYLPINIVAKKICDISINNYESNLFNICSGEPITILELVSNYIKLRGSKIKLNLGYYPYQEYEPMHFWGIDQEL